MGCQRAGRYSEHLARAGELLIGGGWERSRVVLPQPLMRTPRIRLKVGNAQGLVVTFRTAVCALRNTTPRRASAAGTVKVAENEPLRDGMTLATIAPLATVPLPATPSNEESAPAPQIVSSALAPQQNLPVTSSGTGTTSPSTNTRSGRKEWMRS